MKNTSCLTPPYLYGIYQLNMDGFVLHSRVRQNTERINLTAALSGRDFFDEVLACDNSPEFRRPIERFINGRTSCTPKL